MQSSSLRFATAVQALATATRSLGLTMPGFRSPPRLVGVQRSIKRWPSGATVAVVVRGRPWAAVQADLVDGIVTANRLEGAAADHVRAALWLALEGGAAANPAAGPRAEAPHADRRSAAPSRRALTVVSAAEGNRRAA